jgi:hypothetical protein
LEQHNATGAAETVLVPHAALNKDALNAVETDILSAKNAMD